MTWTHLILPAADLAPFEPGQRNIDFSALNTHEAHWTELPQKRITAQADSACMPYEIAHAQALSIPCSEGQIPWAAYETQTLGQPCAWVHPCHLEVGMTDMVLQPPKQLHLSEAQSRQLHALLAPYFEQDGIALRYHSAARWLALSQQWAGFKCISLARAQGRSINDFLPAPGQSPRQLRLASLQAQVQMLLYTHPINQARQSEGLHTVNSFWVDGAGQLDTLPNCTGQVQLDTRLADAASHPSAYASAWRSMLEPLQQQAKQAIKHGAAFHLTLSGAQAAITLHAHKPRWTSQIRSLLGREPLQNLHDSL